MTAHDIRPLDYVRTPHAAKGRFYRVESIDTYPNGTACARMMEIGAGKPAISYPVALLTRCGYFG